MMMHPNRQLQSSPQMKRAIAAPPSRDVAALAFLDLLVAIGREVYPYSVHGPNATTRYARDRGVSQLSRDSSTDEATKAEGR